MSDRVQQFTDFRKRMNERILGQDNQVVRRFFALDTQTYKAGKLDEARTILTPLLIDSQTPRAMLDRFGDPTTRAKPRPRRPARCRSELNGIRRMHTMQGLGVCPER